MKVPHFLLGHNALIGVNHLERAAGGPKRALTDADREFLTNAVAAGVEGIVLDDHPVAIQAAHFLADKHPDVTIIPMLPYAQQVVDSASKTGLAGLAKEMAGTSASMGIGRAARTAGDLALGRLPQAGARVALSHYLRGFPSSKAPIFFMHNAVTDLLVAWGATASIAGWAKASRERGGKPGFVTLNPGSIPWIREIAGPDAWFMCGVNSRGIQMSPSREAAEEVLQDRHVNVVAMSVLGGGLLRAHEEIPRAFRFPAVKSVVVGTSRIAHLQEVIAISGRTETTPRAG